MSIDCNFDVDIDKENHMGIDGRSAGRRKIEYKYTGQFDSWVLTTREFLGTLLPDTISRRVAGTFLIAAGLKNEEVMRLTGLCIRSVQTLRKLMKESEANSEIFKHKPGSGRKRKTEGIEEEVFAVLDKEEFENYQQVVDMLKEKFGIVATRQLASRLVSRWKKARKATKEG